MCGWFWIEPRAAQCKANKGSKRLPVSLSYREKIARNLNNSTLNMVLFMTHHSLDKMSQFTSYLRLLFLSEVKYGECFLPAGEKKLRAAHWRSPVDKYRLFLSFQAMMSLVSPKVWPSLISINHRGAYPQISFKLVSFAWKAHKLVVSIYLW